ncbi:MAG: serine hydrolase domain-containing protein [Vicinamibacteria bacterium]
MTKQHLLLSTLLLCLSLSGGAQTAPPALILPDTPVGKAVSLFVKALNSGSLQELQKFHTDRGGDAGMADGDLNFYQQSGGLDFLKVAKSTDFEIDIESKTRKGGRPVVLHFAVERTPPYTVADIGVRPLGGGPGPGAGGPEAAPRAAGDIIGGAPAVIDEAVAAGFSGVILVAKDGQIAIERAAGFANRGFDVKNQIDTKFNLGSINKTFTRLAIAQLVEAGKLSFDDKLGRFLPEFPNADAAAKVTVSHLLEMKSGIGDFFGREFDATPKDRIRKLADYLPFFSAKPLAFEPGTAEAYSNGGYVTLGLIIEKVSGQSYYDYVREHIYKPAGMTNTDAFEVDAIVPNLAVGYTKRGKTELSSNVYTLPARGSSAGGGYSTAHDLLKYAEAVVANRLASPAYTAWYLGGPQPVKGGAPRPDGPMRGGLGVAGGSPGVNGVLELNAAQRLVIVVLANDDPPAAEAIARKIRLGR